MPRTIQISPVALLLGAAALALSVSLISPRSEAQHAISAQPIGNWWPPHPRDQIQLKGENIIPAAAGGASVTLYTVPLDKWFVVVPSAAVAKDGGNPFAGPTLGATTVSPSGAFTLSEWNGVVLTTRADILPTAYLPEIILDAAPPSPQSSMGWKFPPGSSVVLKEVTGTGGHVVYNLFGYLAPL